MQEEQNKREQELKKWIELLRKNEAHCYFKKNKRKHDSGYGCFEVGYMTERGCKMKEKLIIRNGTDHIWINDLSKKINNFDLNLDVTLDGYVRIFSHTKKIKWEDGFAYSSMRFEVLN